MPNYFDVDAFSVSYVDEDTFGVRKTSGHSVMKCTLPDVSFAQEIETFSLGKSSDFEADEVEAHNQLQCLLNIPWSRVVSPPRTAHGARSSLCHAGRRGPQRRNGC